MRKLCGVAALLTCSWVLWGDSLNTGKAAMNGVSERSLEVKAAYPNDAYSQCVSDAQTRTERSVASGKSSPNIKRSKYALLMGNQHRSVWEFNNGAMVRVTYMCLPDTVRP